MIYLDYAAHAPADPAVLERFCDTERRFTANPNSVHAAGKAAREEMARVTEQIAALTGAAPSEVIFTSGATEANNLAIKGIAQASRHIGRHIISTPLEHSSVSGSLTALQERGWEIDLLSIGRDGRIDPEEVRELLRPDTVLAAVCAVDSELGTVQPVEEIAALLADRPNCRLHVDATQAVGRIPVSFSGIDTMSFAPHKFGGLCGSGVLLKRSRMPLEPQMHGGASTTLYRSGTPALGLAAATAFSLELAGAGRDERCAIVRRHSARLRKALSAFVDSTQETMTGTTRVKLYKGSCTPAGTKSPYSLYSMDFATFDADDVYNQKDAGGFINCFGLPMKIRAMLLKDGEKFE